MRLLAALMLAGCWGYPTLAITARGNAFSFARCGALDKAPQLQSIEVRPTDEGGRGNGPPVCQLALRGGLGTAPVRDWAYGAPLPTLTLRSCGPLTPGRPYRIDIWGGGAGTAIFTAGQDGTIVVKGTPCR